MDAQIIKIFWIIKDAELQHHPITSEIFLLPDRTLVESQLLTLQDVTIDTAALARAGRNDGVETAGLELPLDGGLDLAGEQEKSKGTKRYKETVILNHAAV